MSVTLLAKWNLLQAIVCDPKLSSTAKIVAARLLGHFNNGSEVCNPSYATLARGIGLSRRRAMAGAHELREAGWLVIKTTTHEQTKGKAKGLPSNMFHFDWNRAPSGTFDTSPSAKHDTTLVSDLDHPTVRSDTNPGVRSVTQTLEALNTVKNTGRGTARAPNGAAPHHSFRNSRKPSLSKLALQAGGHDVDGDEL